MARKQPPYNTNLHVGYKILPIYKPLKVLTAKAENCSSIYLY